MGLVRFLYAMALGLHAHRCFSHVPRTQHGLVPRSDTEMGLGTRLKETLVTKYFKSGYVLNGRITG